MNSSDMWENLAKWYQICSTLTLTRHELDVLHKLSTISMLKVINASDYGKVKCSSSRQP